MASPPPPGHPGAGSNGPPGGNGGSIESLIDSLRMDYQAKAVQLDLARKRTAEVRDSCAEKHRQLASVNTLWASLARGTQSREQVEAMCKNYEESEGEVRALTEELRQARDGIEAGRDQVAAARMGKAKFAEEIMQGINDLEFFVQRRTTGALDGKQELMGSLRSLRELESAQAQDLKVAEINLRELRAVLDIKNKNLETIHEDHRKEARNKSHGTAQRLQALKAKIHEERTKFDLKCEELRRTNEIQGSTLNEGKVLANKQSAASALVVDLPFSSERVVLKNRLAVNRSAPEVTDEEVDYATQNYHLRCEIKEIERQIKVARDRRDNLIKKSRREKLQVERQVREAEAILSRLNQQVKKEEMKSEHLNDQAGKMEQLTEGLRSAIRSSIHTLEAEKLLATSGHPLQICDHPSI